MTRDKKVRRISAVFAAVGLVVLTVFGVAGADEPYNDSNVGISSAFEIYADAQVAKEESVQMASAVDSADGNDSDGSPDGQAVSQDTSSETESDSKEDSDRTAADTQKQAAADEEKNGSTDVTETAQDQTSDDTDAEETDGQAAVASAETADGVSQENDEAAAVSQSSGQTQYPQFEGQCIAVADDYVNVRAEADINSEVVGIIPAAGVASVVEIGDEWTKVTSGSCEGYINNAYLAYGDDAGRYAEANCSKQATVTTETLNVRAEADVSSDCVSLPLWQPLSQFPLSQSPPASLAQPEAPL